MFHAGHGGRVIRYVFIDESVHELRAVTLEEPNGTVGVPADEVVEFLRVVDG